MIAFVAMLLFLLRCMVATAGTTQTTAHREPLTNVTPGVRLSKRTPSGWGRSSNA